MSHDLHHDPRDDPTVFHSLRLAEEAGAHALPIRDEGGEVGVQTQHDDTLYDDDLWFTSTTSPYQPDLTCALEAGSENSPYYGSQYTGTFESSRETDGSSIHEAVFPDWQSVSSGITFGTDDLDGIDPCLPAVHWSSQIEAREAFGARQITPQANSDQYSALRYSLSASNGLDVSSNIPIHLHRSGLSSRGSVTTRNPRYHADFQARIHDDSSSIAASPRTLLPSTASQAYGTTIGTPASMTDPEIARCPDCATTFKGVYAQGNLGRHRRQKHLPRSRIFLCESSGCSKQFQRADARRKHYRAHHRHLVEPFASRSAREDGTTSDNRIDNANESQVESQGLISTAPSLQPINDEARAYHVDMTSSKSAAVESKPVTPSLQATYRCEDCGREFDQNADLLRHKRTHTDKSERPHKCAQCAQTFLYPKDLKRHQATHLDNGDNYKPSFHCCVTSCEHGPGRQGFSRNDGLMRHMRRFHPELIVEKKKLEIPNTSYTLGS